MSCRYRGSATSNSGGNNLGMDYTILFIVLVVASLQSVFGVGILLFGTPLLLLYGCRFDELLGILLPISIAINFLQIVSNYRLIDRGLLASFLLYCMPFIVVFLMFVLKTNLNLYLIVGLFLIFSSVSMTTKVASKALQKLMGYEKLYFVAMGLTHGLSNLGGSLLAPFMLSKFEDKNSVRVNIAAFYICFAIFQMLTVFSGGIDIAINYVYVAMGILVYFLVSIVFDKKISSIKYKYGFAILLLIGGVVIILKGLFGHYS